MLPAIVAVVSAGLRSACNPLWRQPRTHRATGPTIKAKSVAALGCLLLAAAGCSDSNKPKTVVVDLSQIPAVTIPAPSIIEQARLDASAAFSGIDALKGAGAGISTVELEKRLKAMGFGVEVKKDNLPLFLGNVDGQFHGVVYPEGRTTISAIKGFSSGGRNMLERFRANLILDRIERVTDEWSVVIGKLPADIANIPYFLQPSFGMEADDRGLDPTFVNVRLARFGVKLPMTTDHRAADQPQSSIGKCFTRGGDALPDKDCKDVIVGYSASYFVKDEQSSTASACRGEICALSLYIKDSQLDWDIQKQISGAGRAIFVKAFGEPDPETK
ncbi:hypothetical protein ACFSOZ_11695 [Mesorhizobium newzealandense]|uniref:Uncharacterized protein n=1 Tax=Mesorhizobium newzealandense TaxID=1300302 RepID=A0ABW4U7G8_9HYPH